MHGGAGAFAGVCPGAEAMRGKKRMALFRARVASTAHLDGQVDGSYAECMARGLPWSSCGEAVGIAGEARVGSDI